MVSKVSDKDECLCTVSQGQAFGGSMLPYSYMIRNQPKPTTKGAASWLKSPTNQREFAAARSKLAGFRFVEV